MTEWGIYSPDCHLFFLFLLGDSPTARRSAADSSWLGLQRSGFRMGMASLYSYWATAHSEKKRSAFELARLVAQRDNTCPAHLILFFILSFDV